MYGRGTASIAEQMGISTDEAAKIISDFFDTFPKVQDFVQQSQEFARDYGFVQTAWGRKRRLPDMQLDPIEVTDENGNHVDNKTYGKYYQLMKKSYGLTGRKKVIELAATEGYTIKDNTGYIKQAERQCVNSIIQGSAADITKIAMIRIANDPEMQRLGYKLILPVHDEILGVCPEENAKEVATRLEHMMVHIVDGKFDIQMKTDIEVTHKWYGEGIDWK